MNHIRYLDGSATELKDFIVRMVSKIRFTRAMIEDIVKGKYSSAIPMQTK